MKNIMTIKIIIAVAFFYCSNSKIALVEASKQKLVNKTPLRVRTTTTTEAPVDVTDNRSKLYKTPDILIVPDKIDIVVKKKVSSDTIPPRLVAEWAEEIANKLVHVEKQVVRREFILDKFKDIKREVRDGAAIVEKMAASLEELLEKRAQAAEAVGREAERIAAEKPRDVPYNYLFDNSIGLQQLKPLPEEPEDEYEMACNCSSLNKADVEEMTHFGTGSLVTLDTSSVKVAAEVFDCDPRVLEHIHWSEGLIHTFKRNYAQDAMTDFQYFCSAKGFMRHFPAASWESLFMLNLEGPADVYDCRLRPWYVAAGGAPRDVLILFDASGSMVNSTNLIYAEQFTLALLSALTDDDQVNVLRFNVEVESPISCFNDKLVPANHVNSAAMMAALHEYKNKNETKLEKVLRKAVKMLRLQQKRKDSPIACQQAIVLLSDAIEENFTQIMRDLDPSGSIRLIVIWLHDVWGLRDNSREFGGWLACSSDGYFVELTTWFDVTEQVLQTLRVLERPLVHQRKQRIRVFTDVYANIEDPRRAEYYWRIKENAEQAYRYKELRRNKKRFLSEGQRYEDYMHQLSLDRYGQYYEGEGLDYRLMISVSVPVFEDTTVENITIKLAEEHQRNSTRTYPVNRLLGVAGVDIPIEHLKLILPYYLLGAGGSLFIVDHRGNIVLHDNLKPLFDGDLLKPGYRTVDMLDLEQSAHKHPPRNYSKQWLDFRNAVVIEQPRGSRELDSKYIFEKGMRAFLERREYHWKRVHNHYTVVVSLPKYNKRHAVPDGSFTQQLAAKALDAMRFEFTVHPEWMYCKHVDQHFKQPELEVRHFVRRRMEEPNFKMQNLYHRFSPIKPTMLEKTYMCNEELIARFCKEAIATQQWAEEHEDKEAGRVCDGCELGSVTAFFASESGLTRWQQYHLVSGLEAPPDGSEWPRGPAEAWYKRAAATPGTLVVHAPVTPVRRMRRSEDKPPAFKTSELWLTAARTLGPSDKGMIGVAGYHFYPAHLEAVLQQATDPPCPDETDCDPHCDGENWVCVLIDEGGWLVAGWELPEDPNPEDPVREHLARIYPHAMKALLDNRVFELHWIHDYQGVCFPFEEEPAKQSAAKMIPMMLKSVWKSLTVLLQVTRELLTIVAFLNSGGLASADTEFEQQKRRNATKKNYERVKFETLYDDRVLVNRTRIAACDRSRPLYELQRSPKALEALRRAPQNCSWPVTGAAVGGTNLFLLAVNRLCPYPAPPAPPVLDPLINYPVEMMDPEWKEDDTMTAAARLACWRNRVPLPIRSPNIPCFPHEYQQEEGYRQCGPWLPDPEPTEAAARAHGIHNLSDSNLIMSLLVFCMFVTIMTL